MKPFTAACIQLTIRNRFDENLARVTQLTLQAAEEGAHFITLPENILYMSSAFAEMLKAPLQTYADEMLAALQAIAKKHNIWILIGSLPIPHGKKFWNRSHLINHEGKLVSIYDKIHLCDITLPGGQSLKESERYESGAQAVVADLPWCKLGLTICYDVRFPQLYRELAVAGASMFAVPSAFTKPTGEAHWHVLLRARAIENGCFVIAPAQVGEFAPKRFTYGHSLIVNPWGEVLADGGDAEGIILSAIDVAQVQEARAKIPSLSHSRNFKKA